MDAIHLNTPDRVPVVLEYAGFAARVTGIKMADFISSRTQCIHTMIQAYQLIGNGDAINYPAPSGYGLAYMYLSKVRLPGVDLPDNDEWQVHESELMTRSDYDLILEMGWPDFFKMFLETRIFDDAAKELLPENQEDVDMKQLWKNQGVPVLSGGNVPTPMELICGARSLMPFIKDQFQIPDKLEKIFQHILPHLAKDAISYTRDKGYPCTWVLGCRSAPSMMSPQMWDRWVWPYFKFLVNEVVDAGQIALLHLDSSWTRELKRFRELPGGKCLMSLDGGTDIRSARRILDGHMCIQGDIPASMLAFDQPEDVTRYARKLIHDLGPDGFILHSGCDIPANAKLENVQAMVRSALEQ